MKECDNSTRKIHISNNFILSISLLIIFDTLLLRPSLHCNTSLHFTLHPTTHTHTPTHTNTTNTPYIQTHTHNTHTHTPHARAHTHTHTHTHHTQHTHTPHTHTHTQTHTERIKAHRATNFHSQPISFIYRNPKPFTSFCVRANFSFEHTIS